MAAIGKFVLWGKENLCLIRPQGDALALETLFFAEDVRVEAEIEEAVGRERVKDAELDLARQVIESISGDFDPEEFRNEYRDDLRRMLEAKLAGQEIVEAGARARDAGDRPDGGAQGERRRDEEAAGKEGRSLRWPEAPARSGARPSRPSRF